MSCVHRQHRHVFAPCDRSLVDFLGERCVRFLRKIEEVSNTTSSNLCDQDTTICVLSCSVEPVENTNFETRDTICAPRSVFTLHSPLADTMECELFQNRLCELSEAGIWTCVNDLAETAVFR